MLTNEFGKNIKNYIRLTAAMWIEYSINKLDEQAGPSTKQVKLGEDPTESIHINEIKRNGCSKYFTSTGACVSDSYCN